MDKKKDYDLEERLIDFAVRIIRLADSLPRTRAGNHVAGQIVRSGTSPAPNYAEAKDAESRNDFVHKIKIVLKELRETYVWLRIIQRAKLLTKVERIKELTDECNELISIFVKSAKTAKNNSVKSKK
ncbi:MAG: four helix bundle protein [Sedimentisphaerales bacterium]|nr:four helix bundle protein [Sedimentisphaerales bacterium]